MELGINNLSLNAEGKKLFLSGDEENEVGRTYVYFLFNDLHEEPFALIEDVFVEEGYRGQGWGSRLVKEAISEAKKRGCHKIIMTSRNSNSTVHEWYKKMGFLEHGKEFRMDIDPSQS